MAQACIRHPALLPGLVAVPGPLARPNAAGEIAGLLDQCLAGVAEEPALAAALRGFRRLEMVRIIWRDLAGTAPLAETLEDLSALADACICGALDLLQTWTRAELGTPLDAEGQPQAMVVLGMGKLGARELNLSSDIDLIFAYAHNGAVEGSPATADHRTVLHHPPRPAPGPGPGQPDRRRLRLPGGHTPAPLRQRRAPGHEFPGYGGLPQSQAREWERYTMIKARVVCGEPSAASQITALLRPLVFRRYLDYGAIESLRDSSD